MHLYYIKTFINSVNISAEIWLAGILLVSSLTVIGVWYESNKQTYANLIMRVTLVLYAFFVLCVTVLLRKDWIDAGIRLTPFWSYAAIIDGELSIMWEVVLNIALFIPAGFLYSYAVRRGRWWIMLCVAATFSFSIELLQLIFHCGLTEVDDIIHNSLGALLGYVVGCSCKALISPKNR